MGLSSRHLLNAQTVELFMNIIAFAKSADFIGAGR